MDKLKSGHFLPELPNAGLLWKTMGIGHYHWMYFTYPDDFYQEAALFLISQQTTLNSKEDILLFCRAAYRHFYQVTITYGWHKTDNGSFGQREQYFPDIDSLEIKFRITTTQTLKVTPDNSIFLPPENHNCFLKTKNPPSDEEMITRLQDLAKELKKRLAKKT